MAMSHFKNELINITQYLYLGGWRLFLFYVAINTFENGKLLEEMASSKHLCIKQSV